MILPAKLLQVLSQGILGEADLLQILGRRVRNRIVKRGPNQPRKIGLELSPRRLDYRKSPATPPAPLCPPCCNWMVSRFLCTTLVI